MSVKSKVQIVIQALDDNSEDLSKMEYKEYLEELQDAISSRLDCVNEELEDEG